MTENTQIVTVLTGDLVNSTALGAEKVEMAFERLQEVAKDLEAWHGGSLLFTRHRGDGWQVLLRDKKFSIRSALAFRTAVKSLGKNYDTYIGIASDELFQLAKNDLNTMSDPVFIASGNSLDAVKLKSDRVLHQIKSQGTFTPKIGDITNKRRAAFVTLADQIINNWTTAQADAVYPMLNPINTPKVTEVAKMQGKLRQSISKSLNAAGFYHLHAALKFWESVDD